MVTPIRDVRELREDRSGSRARPNSPYSSLQYYDDVGTVATKKGYENWREGQDNFNKYRKDSKSALEDYQGKIDKSKKGIQDWKDKTGGSADAWFGNVWKELGKDKDFRSFKVLNPDGSVGGVYQLHKDQFNNKWNYKTAYYLQQQPKDKDGNIILKTVSTRNPMINDGQPVNKIVINGNPAYEADLITNKLKSDNDLLYKEFKKKNYGKIQKAYTDNYGQVVDAETKISGAEGTYDLESKKRADLIRQKETADADIRKQYKNRIAGMKDLFGGINIERK